MKIVAPTTEFRQYQILCPKCRWPWWFTHNQIKGGKLKFVCDCGYCFVPALNPNIKLNKEEPRNNTKFTELVDSLKNWGYSRKEAKDRVSAVYDKGKTVETLLREAIFYDTGPTT